MDKIQYIESIISIIQILSIINDIMNYMIFSTIFFFSQLFLIDQFVKNNFNLKIVVKIVFVNFFKFVKFIYKNNKIKFDIIFIKIYRNDIIFAYNYSLIIIRLKKIKSIN